MSAWDTRDNVTDIELQALPARLPNPGSIPPRPWLYGTILLRGFVTVLVAPGGTGKSQLAMGIAVALSSGKTILSHHVHHRVNAWLLNLEDPLDEMDRRLAALMIHHHVSNDDLRGRLFMNSGRDHRICMARRNEERTVIFPDKPAVIGACKDGNVGVIVVDPFVKSHQLEENSNSDMDAAATAWAEVAEQTGAAVLLVHHVRKGAVMDIDAARGGKALTDAARAALMLSPMSPEEGEELGIRADDRWRHVRLDDGKANMAPKAGKAQWFRMEMIELGNGTPDYPNGDKVAALAPWEPPNVWASLEHSDIHAALQAIHDGLGGGRRYSATQRGRENTRWVGQPVIERMGVNEAQAKTIVTAWFKSGLLFEQDYHDPDQRRNKRGVFVDFSKAPDAF